MIPMQIPALVAACPIRVRAVPVLVVNCCVPHEKAAATVFARDDNGT
jgi:hypothetical protein